MSDYKSMDENALLSLCAAGDRGAEELVSEKYLPLVRACSRTFFLAGGDMEDLIQEGMLGLLSAIRSYNPALNTQFNTYAEHCIKNRILSAVRSASCLKHFPLNDSVPIDEMDEDGIAPLSSGDPALTSPEEYVLAIETREELKALIDDCLSKFERKVINLYLEGMSYNEIAVILNKNIKSVDNAVQRTRHKLAEKLSRR